MNRQKEWLKKLVDFEERYRDNMVKMAKAVCDISEVSESLDLLEDMDGANGEPSYWCNAALAKLASALAHTVCYWEYYRKEGETHTPDGSNETSDTN